MAIEKVDIQKFLSLARSHPVLDVRSPGEYLHAHIPGAYNLPLFSDEQRKIVGTLYKQVGREAAIRTGLDFFGPQMRPMIGQAITIFQDFHCKQEGARVPAARTTGVILTHCWRGGMRSAGVCWLLDLYGFKVYSLLGGYKAYRRWVLDRFNAPYPFRILGGLTGTGKTRILQELKKRKEYVLDLEEMAHHRGSAFGGIGLAPPPTQEMFENHLADELFRMTESRKLDGKKESVIWLEDESQSIGPVVIPEKIWKQKQNSPVLFLELPFEKRLEFLMQEYGQLDPLELEQALIRIQKRLGGQQTKTAMGYLKEGNLMECFR
ncbi:MAG: tRNA 2-selenouridine(34) synthase MnmH, partial [Chitinophagaceae bacterium]